MYSENGNRTFKKGKTRGKVISVEDLETRNGKYCVTARVREASGNIVVCKLWDSLAHKFWARQFLHCEAYIEGFFGNEGDLIGKFFDGKGAGGESRELGITEQSRKEYLEYLERHDMCLVPYDGEPPFTAKRMRKEDCLKVNGKWWSKIMYCIEILGAKEVMSKLRDLSLDGLLSSAVSSSYKERLASMIELCRDMTGDNIEFWSKDGRAVN